MIKIDIFWNIVCRQKQFWFIFAISNIQTIDIMKRVRKKRLSQRDTAVGASTLIIWSRQIKVEK